MGRLHMVELEKYINNPSQLEAFNLGYAYEKWNQLAAAIEFYLEAADSSEVTLTTYESLVRAAICYERQGNRTSTVRDLLYNAVALQPNAIEAHFLLSRQYEWSKQWHESFMHACIGLDKMRFVCVKPIEGLYGAISLYFQKGVAAWWIGMTEESRTIMYEVYLGSKDLRQVALKNLRSIGYPRDLFQYNRKDAGKIIDKFNGYGLIEQNYAQAAQDMFVLTALDGLVGGTYLEIGSADPIMFNNTYLLEKDFQWRGLSLDIGYHHIAKHKVTRSNQAVCADALTYPYAPGVIDYLQVDCEPANVTFDILKRVFACGVRPRVITFEHDRHTYGPSIAAESRHFLSEAGYILKVKDVKFDHLDSPFEDWWILPELNGNVPRFEENILGIDYILKK